MKYVMLLLAVFALGLAPAACGKKPGTVSAPQGEEADRFPRTYPAR